MQHLDGERNNENFQILSYFICIEVLGESDFGFEEEEVSLDLPLGYCTLASNFDYFITVEIFFLYI